MNQPRNLTLVVLVGLALLMTEGNKVISIGAPGKFCFHIRFPAAQQQGADAVMQSFEIEVLLRASAFVQLIKLPIESKERSEDGRIKKVDNRIELVDAIFDWGACQHERIPAPQPL